MYQQVCAACHSVNQLSFRNLVGVAYSEAEVKAMAEELEVCCALPLNLAPRHATRAGKQQTRFRLPASASRRVAWQFVWRLHAQTLTLPLVVPC